MPGSRCFLGSRCIRCAFFYYSYTTSCVSCVFRGLFFCAHLCALSHWLTRGFPVNVSCLFPTPYPPQCFVFRYNFNSLALSFVLGYIRSLALQSVSVLRYPMHFHHELFIWKFSRIHCSFSQVQIMTQVNGLVHYESSLCRGGSRRRAQRVRTPPPPRWSFLLRIHF